MEIENVELELFDYLEKYGTLDYVEDDWDNDGEYFKMNIDAASVFPVWIESLGVMRSRVGIIYIDSPFPPKRKYPSRKCMIGEIYSGYGLKVSDKPPKEEFWKNARIIKEGGFNLRREDIIYSTPLKKINDILVWSLWKSME